jgi:hypothetical protein
MLEDRASSRGIMMTANFAGINLAVMNSVMLGFLLAVRAVNIVWVRFAAKPFEASVIILKNLLKVFEGKFVHSGGSL